MTNHIFVLSYRGAQQFFENKKFQEFERSTFYFIDNGQQTYNNSLGCWSYTTERNIGCAGGWNLICKIAFDWFNLDKIIITQDDATFSESDIEDALHQTSDKTLTGVLSPFFEFSCFAISKSTYKTVGAFDENFLWVYSEDADYKQRCMLSGVTINSLFVDPKGANQSLSVKADPSINRILENRAYLTLKWGQSVHPIPSARADFQPPFEHRTPFSDIGMFPTDFIPVSDAVQKQFKCGDRMPSQIEYNKFLRGETNGNT